jgi:signal transduction histidine kinase/ActR/RegA family two-component response regulator
VGNDVPRFELQSHLDPPMSTPKRVDFAWSALPAVARVYVAAVIAVGAAGFVLFFPNVWPQPDLFVFLLLAACLTSVWKVNLPISLLSGSTLSVSYAADLTALLLLGPRAALLIAVAGVWTQCTFHVKKRYPLYRTVFSMCAESMTMIATGFVYSWLGGSQGPFDESALPKPLVGAIATHFVLNTGLVAAAIGLSSGRSPVRVWRDDFLWSGVSYIVAGTAGAAAAIVIDRGNQWKAVLLLAPVYMTYRSYRMFVGRLEDQRRHVVESERLHRQAIDALSQLRAAESERNQLLEREQAARASAEQANRLKDQFLAMVSHELRTPLNAVLGWADMLRNGSLDAVRSRRAVHAIHESAKRQAYMIDELLDVSRIISGKLRLERGAVDLHEIVRSAVEVVQPSAYAKNIDLVVDIDSSVGPFDGDGARLQQIVWNLLANAVKFTPERGALFLSLHRTRQGVEIAVTDTGIGIPAEFLPSVFEPFRQADGSSTRRHSGLGLGLSIVKQLVEAHGGTITAESAGEGKGSTFTVQLPIAAMYSEETAARRAEGAAPERRTGDTSLGGLSVLVVDDDDGSRDVVAAYLESRNAIVFTAASTAQAIELVQREHVDVMLADIAMPDEDGYGLIRRLRAMESSGIASIPAAALTAFAREEDRNRALQAGFQMHLAKPIDRRSLVDAVASLGRRKVA